MRAAKALPEVDVVRGALLLECLANGPFFDAHQSAEAAEALAQVAAHQEQSVSPLAGRATGMPAPRPSRSSDPPSDRTPTVQTLADDVERDAQTLENIATDLYGRDPFRRLRAARALAQKRGHQHRGAWLLETLVTDPTLEAPDQMRAAKALVEMDSEWMGPVLADVGVERTAQVLESIVTDPAAVDSRRLRAARALAQIDGYRDTSARLFEAWGLSIKQPIRALAEMDLERAARLYETLATDPTLTTVRRLQAARMLAEVDLERAARLYETLATDPTMTTPGRLQAAQALAEVDGHRDHGARLLGAFAMDPTLDASDRVWAAAMLARADGYHDHGVRLLETLTTEPTLDAFGRDWAGRKLAKLRERKARGR